MNPINYSFHPSINPDKLLCHSLSRDTKTSPPSPSHPAGLSGVPGPAERPSHFRVSNVLFRVSFKLDVPRTPSHGGSPSDRHTGREGVLSVGYVPTLWCYSRGTYLEHLSRQAFTRHPRLNRSRLNRLVSMWRTSRTTKSSSWVYEHISTSWYPKTETNFSRNFRKSKKTKKKNVSFLFNSVCPHRALGKIVKKSLGEK